MGSTFGSSPASGKALHDPCKGLWSLYHNGKLTAHGISPLFVVHVVLKAAQAGGARTPRPLQGTPPATAPESPSPAEAAARRESGTV